MDSTATSRPTCAGCTRWITANRTGPLAASPRSSARSPTCIDAWVRGRALGPARPALDRCARLDAVIGLSTGGCAYRDVAHAGDVRCRRIGLLGPDDDHAVDDDRGVALAMLIGVPLGIWSALSDEAERGSRPLLDTAQVMPAYVYLIACSCFFGIRYPPRSWPPSSTPCRRRCGSRSPAFAGAGRHRPRSASRSGDHTAAAPRQGADAVGSAHDPPRSQPGDHDGLRHRRDRLADRHRRCRRQGARGTAEARRGPFAAGFCIVFAAIALDRITTGERPSSTATERVITDRRKLWIAASSWSWSQRLIVETVLVVPRRRGDIKRGRPVIVEWVGENLRQGVPIIGGTRSDQRLPRHATYGTPSRVPRRLPWLVVVAGIGRDRWLSGGWRLGATVAACMIGIAVMGTCRAE